MNIRSLHLASDGLIIAAGEDHKVIPELSRNLILIYAQILIDEGYDPEGLTIITSGSNQRIIRKDGQLELQPIV